MVRLECLVLMVGALGLVGCGECERLAAPLDAELKVTNDLDETYEVTVRATQAIYALGTDIDPDRCALWPLSAGEYSIEVFGPACMGESEPFAVAVGDVTERTLSSIPCE